jgi:hypothetical protein
LAVGDYLIHEETVPDGYTAAEDRTETVAAGATTEITITNTPAVGAILIQKVDGTNGNAPLGGSCFTLSGQADVGPICDNAPEDGNGDEGTILVGNLSPGDYMVSESQIPTGYQGGADQPVTVNGGETFEVVFQNLVEPTSTPETPATGSLVVTATDEGGNLLPGACYSLIPRTGTEGERIQRCDDEDGAVDGQVTFPEVPPGNWRLGQYRSPQDFQEPEAQDVEIVAGESRTAGFTNFPVVVTGSLEITKTDDENQLLGGACFTLTGVQETTVCDNEDGDTNGDPGVTLIQGLLPGDYEVSESRTPDGYQTAANQPTTVNPGDEPARLTFVNVPQPSGIDLASQVVYQDDAGRLWIHFPGDQQPTRLDSDDLTFNGAVAPVFSDDRSWLAFFVNNPSEPASNLTLFDVVNKQSIGQVPFGGVGTPTRIAWLPGKSDVLAVAFQTVENPGISNVAFYTANTPNIINVFPLASEPATIEAIVPAPQGTLMAIQATGTDGDPDVYIVDSADPAAPPSPVSVGPNSGADPDYFAGWNPPGDRVLVRSGAGPEYLFAADSGGGTTPLGSTPVFAGDPANDTHPQWSSDGAWVAFFDNAPDAGGQLQVLRVDGSAACGPYGDIRAIAWSPTEVRLAMLWTPANDPTHLVGLMPDCSTPTIADFTPPMDKFAWAPDGQTLALVNRSGGNPEVWLVRGDQAQQVDPNVVGIGDFFEWSPESDALPLYAAGPPGLWVVAPTATTPVMVNGTTLPEGATLITGVWWP